MLSPRVFFESNTSAADSQRADLAMTDALDAQGGPAPAQGESQGSSQGESAPAQGESQGSSQGGSAPAQGGSQGGLAPSQGQDPA